MKKVFLLFAAAAFLISCDNAADTEKRTKDSLDSVAKATKEVVNETADKTKDSVENVTEAQKDAVDSANKVVDTTKKN